jgi:hypothetical protein
MQFRGSEVKISFLLRVFREREGKRVIRAEFFMASAWFWHNPCPAESHTAGAIYADRYDNHGEIVQPDLRGNHLGTWLGLILRGGLRSGTHGKG